MPLGKGIVELFEAIPERIEVDGHEPTWRVTGGSFESVLAFAQEAYDEPVVIAREDKHRWWPRVTLTVTTDPELAAAAPDLDSFATVEVGAEQAQVDGREQERAQGREREPGGTPADEPAGPRRVGRHAAVVPEQREDRETAHDSSDDLPSTLEEIFAAQERSRRERLGIPEQRSH